MHFAWHSETIDEVKKIDGCFTTLFAFCKENKMVNFASKIRKRDEFAYTITLHTWKYTHTHTHTHTRTQLEA